MRRLTEWNLTNLRLSSSSELSNGYKMRRAAIDFNVPLITNSRLATAYIRAFCAKSLDDISIKSWDEY